MWNKRIALTKRDLQIFKLINELWFTQSNTIHNVVSPWTQQKVFRTRLQDLKNHGYIREIGKKERIRNQFSIFAFTSDQNLLSRVKYETGNEISKTYYNTSYSLFNHQLYLWRLFAYFITKLRKQHPEYQLNFDDILGSKSIDRNIKKELSNANTKYQLLEYCMIPDFTLSTSSTLYCLELENLNSTTQFEKKIQGYADLLLRKDNNDFYDLFQGKQIFLVIACWSHKMERYKEILKQYWSGKYILVEIESIL